MITNLDRSGWVGASDIHFLLTSRRTKVVDGREVDLPSWANFKAIKSGLYTPRAIKTKYMTAGDIYERPILDAYGEPIEYDKTIEIPELALRVNLDGNTDTLIVEAKTFRAKNKRIPDAQMKHYYSQVQAQMFAWRQKYGTPIRAVIRSYALLPEDYEAAMRGYALELDIKRLHSDEIPYDEYFINYKMLPKLESFAKWLNHIKEI